MGAVLEVGSLLIHLFYPYSPNILMKYIKKVVSRKMQERIVTC